MSSWSLWQEGNSVISNSVWRRCITFRGKPSSQAAAVIRRWSAVSWLILQWCHRLVIQMPSMKISQRDWSDCSAIHSQVTLQLSPIYHNIKYSTAITVAESESNLRITTDTPYLTIKGELWVVDCEEFGENWLHYNGTALYSAGCWQPSSILYYVISIRHLSNPSPVHCGILYDGNKGNFIGLHQGHKVHTLYVTLKFCIFWLLYTQTAWVICSRKIQ